MKLLLNETGSSLSFARVAPGYVDISGKRYTRGLTLFDRTVNENWAQAYDELTAQHFSPLAEFSPELVLFGSGTTFRFPLPEWIAELTERQIPVETMDTAAACRTYNVLVGEGRRVAAAILIT